jgi:inner membrane protein
MPSAFAHAAPALALVPAFWKPRAPTRLWVLGVLLAAAPDLDVVTLSLGIPYDHALGHRGLSHSVAFAAVAAAAVVLIAFPRPPASFSRARIWLYLFLAIASHGLLDTCTNGGRGVALLAPFDQTRYFSPFRPIEVSPLSIGPFFSARGAAIVRSELVWVWIPATALGAALLLWRSRYPSASGAATIEPPRKQR